MLGSVVFVTGELSLEVETAQPRETHVEHETAGRIPAGSLEERLRGRKHFHRHPHGGDEPAAGVADGSVVVDDEDEGCLRAHRIPGNARWKVAPWPGLAVAQSRPRWLSMIERLIESPMPRPSRFVV
jgi:hypothetical protein